MPRSRPMTDLYLAAVERAIEQPGRWLLVPRRFDTEFNASVLVSCLQGGYLRVCPREGDRPIVVAGKRCIRTAAPVDAEVKRIDDGWQVVVRGGSTGPPRPPASSTPASTSTSASDAGGRSQRSQSDDVTSCIARLASAGRHFLRDLPALDVSRLAGIYVLWFEDELLYAGIARVDPSSTSNLQAAGVAGRLSTYRRCRLTSDFAIAVAFRFVVPNLSEQDRLGLSSGELGVRAIQAITKDWVATNVRFSVDAVAPAVASAAESAVRRAGLPGSGPPAFNALG